SSDPDAAKLSFLSAVQIDPKIQIDAAYKSAEMAKLLDQARGEAGGGGSASEPVVEAAPPVEAGPVECSSVKGLQHAVIDTAASGKALPVEALLAPAIKPAKVVIMVRAEGATDFTEVKMTKQAGCKYTGQVPATALHGGLVHYYIAAYDGGVKPIASKGS